MVRNVPVSLAMLAAASLAYVKRMENGDPSIEADELVGDSELVEDTSARGSLFDQISDDPGSLSSLVRAKSSARVFSDVGKRSKL